MKDRNRDPIASATTLGRRPFLAGLSCLPAALLVSPSPARASVEAKLDLAGLERRFGGRLGVSVSGGGRRAAWRGGERFAFCSTFKLFLAACVLERAQEGLERLDRAIPVTADDMVAHAPVTGPAVGSTLTIEALCKATVELSDNPAANILIREIGGLDAWRTWYRTIGDRVTRVDRYETALNSALPDDPRDTTTPDQFLTNLEMVMTSSLLSAYSLALLTTWLLETPTGAGRIRAGVPAGYSVGHKTGTGARNTHNDIGMIWPVSGEPLHIVVFYTDARDASADQLDAVVAEAVTIALAGIGHS